MILIIGGEERQSVGQKTRSNGIGKGLPEACLGQMRRLICNQKCQIHGGFNARNSEDAG